MEKFLQGISDSTLGDRAKAVKTYREFVVPWLCLLMEQWTKAPGLVDWFLFGDYTTGTKHKSTKVPNINLV